MERSRVSMVFWVDMSVTVMFPPFPMVGGDAKVRTRCVSMLMFFAPLAGIKVTFDARACSFEHSATMPIPAKSKAGFMLILGIKCKQGTQRVNPNPCPKVAVER